MTQPSLADLTPREREVLHWLAEGKSNGEIAVIIGCSEATVKKHRYRIYRTLEVSNAISALRFYLDAMVAESAGGFLPHPGGCVTKQLPNHPCGEVPVKGKSFP